jgi:leader peptidase (prepilin peptidase) / N-methyltransferase
MSAARPTAVAPVVTFRYESAHASHGWPNVRRMTSLLIAAAALAGLLAGAYLRTWVFHLSVPAGAASRLHCPACGARLLTGLPLPSRLLGPSGRCRACRWRVGPPFAVLELGTAGCVAGLAAVLGPVPELVAYGILAAIGIALVAIDCAVSRLPDRLVRPAYPIVFTALAAAALIDGQPLRILSALLGVLLLGGGFLVLGMLRPGGLGGGDVKVAGLMGLPLGWLSLGWGGTLGPLAGGALAYLLFGAVTLVLLSAHRAHWSDRVQFGPCIVAGAFAILVAA